MTEITQEYWEKHNIYCRKPKDSVELKLIHNDTSGNIETSTGANYEPEMTMYVSFLVKTVPTHYIERRLDAIY